VELPDSDDRHVLAAAIKGGCQLIVTFNLADFPADTLAPHSVAAMHPDAFLSSLCATDAASVIAAAARVRIRLVNPPMTAADYLSALARGDLPLTAQALDPLRDRI
jgi:hypothetical protein